MIRVSVIQADRWRVRVRGHAMTGPHGQDIVCAGVSVLAINTANTLEAVIGLNEREMVTKVEEGAFDLSVRADRLTKRQRRDTHLIFQAFRLGVREIAKAYPNAVHYQEGGVWNDKDAITTVRQQKGRREFEKRS